MTKSSRIFLANHGWTDNELNTNSWKSVDITLLPKAAQMTFNKRKQAIDLFLGTDVKLKEISSITGVLKPDIYRFIERCLETTPSGEVRGYQGLLPYQRSRTSVHHKTITEILENNPQIGDEIKAILLGKTAIPGYPKEHNIAFTILHRYFLQLCLANKFSQDEFPFTLRDHGLRNFQRYAKAYVEAHYNAEVARKSTEGKRLAYMTKGIADPRKQPIYPLERVEFDGHKIDAYFTVGYKMPSGEITKKEISRIWILAVIDVVTRCILGYYITFNPEYNADDVIKTLTNSLQTWQPKEITVDGLSYGEHDGFPSSQIPEAVNTRWLELYLDNGLANRAKRVKEFVTQKLHANYCLGPVANPIRRAHVERFFRRLEDDLIHRLPSTTGSNPSDVKRQSPVKNAIKFNIKVTEIEQIIDVWIARYNNTPHRGIANRTPLQVFEEHVESGLLLPKYSNTEWEELKTLKYYRQINGNKETGIRPYVNFENVRYTNDFLRQSPQLIGKKVMLKVDPDDLRKIKAYLIENGLEIGMLLAKGSWGLEPHDLRLRKAIWRANDETFDVKRLDNPVDSFLRAAEKKGHTDRKVRARVQHRMKLQNELPESFKNKELPKSSISSSQNNHAIGPQKVDLSGLPSSFITKQEQTYE